MRLLRTLLLVPALLALAAGGTGGAAAQGATRGLDPSFGNGGIATLTAPIDKERFQDFKVTPEGRSYILDDSSLLAFGSDGTLDTNFGEGGRAATGPAFGVDEEGATDLAIDSQGHLLVSGSTALPGQTVEKKLEEAYVIRFLPDGSRDPEFGTNGEVDTTFGLRSKTGQAPSVGAAAITVDTQDRPIVGGSFGQEGKCGMGFEQVTAPYVARLTTTGALDPTFAGSGRAIFRGYSTVTGLAPIPGGGFAVFSKQCPTPPRLESPGTEYGAFTEDGEANPAFRKALLGETSTTPLIDSRRRVVLLNSVLGAGSGVDAVARWLPNGRPDPGFGRDGRVALRHKPHYAEAIAVDAKSRPIIALHTKGIVLRRYLQNGKVDRHFGPNGKLTAAGKIPRAIGLDGEGRIYTLSLRAGEQTTLRLARFIPGP